jgi:heptosyltransferase-1
MCRTQTLVDVVRLIKQKYSPYFVFIAGNGEELREVGTLAQEFPHSSHVLYRPDLPFLQRAMNRAQAVLAVDSIILHLASTTQTPTFGFFGPSSALKYAPRGKRHGIFQSACPSNTKFEKRCPLLRTCRTGQCLKSAEVEDMFLAIEQWQDRVRE